jgi:hypothetical protein
MTQVQALPRTRLGRQVRHRMGPCGHDSRVLRATFQRSRPDSHNARRRLLRQNHPYGAWMPQGARVAQGTSMWMNPSESRIARKPSIWLMIAFAFRPPRSGLVLRRLNASLRRRGVSRLRVSRHARARPAPALPSQPSSGQPMPKVRSSRKPSVSGRGTVTAPIRPASSRRAGRYCAALPSLNRVWCPLRTREGTFGSWSGL